MADDLASQLAAAIVTAAVRAAGNESDWPVHAARTELARDLDLILSVHLPQLTAPTDKPPARYTEPGRCGVCGHFKENHRFGPNDDACLPGCGCSYYREPITDTYSAPDDQPYACRYGCLLSSTSRSAVAEHYRHIHPQDAAYLAAWLADDDAEVVRLAAESLDDYSAPDYTPDERHRHTIGGQTWEHAHEGGHEAHSAVSHDLSGAQVVGPLPVGPTERHSFGWETGPSLYGPRGIVARPESSASGNVILRVGNENVGERGWSQVAHVVLTRSEARELAHAIEAEMDDPEPHPEPPTTLSAALKRAQAHRVIDRDALDRLAEMLRANVDLDGSDASDSVYAIVARTGRDVTPEGEED